MPRLKDHTCLGRIGGMDDHPPLLPQHKAGAAGARSRTAGLLKRVHRYECGGKRQIASQRFLRGAELEGAADPIGGHRPVGFEVKGSNAGTIEQHDGGIRSDVSRSPVAIPQIAVGGDDGRAGDEI